MKLFQTYKRAKCFKINWNNEKLNESIIFFKLQVLDMIIIHMNFHLKFHLYEVKLFHPRHYWVKAFNFKLELWRFVKNNFHEIHSIPFFYLTKLLLANIFCIFILHARLVKNCFLPQTSTFFVTWLKKSFGLWISNLILIGLFYWVSGESKMKLWRRTASSWSLIVIAA